MNPKILLAMSMLCLGCTANAADSPSVGDSTQKWLDLQKSGDQASEEKRPLSGDVAKRNYQRYLKSFESEVPQEFDTGVSVD